RVLLWRRRPLRGPRGDRRLLVNVAPVVVINLDRLHHVAGEQPHHALTIPLNSKQSVPLARAHQVNQAGEPELALVERSIDVAQELLDLTDVHRPARRLLRGLKETTDFADAVRGARLGRGARSRGG